jgi:hypothetical protein
MLCGVVTGRTKEPTVTTLRRIAAAPAAAVLLEWRLELLAAAGIAGGLIGMSLGL